MIMDDGSAHVASPIAQTRDEGACENTDRELWREREGDYYADSIFVTAQGGIGINCGGHVFVMPLRDWHRLVIDTCDHKWSDPSLKAERPCYCMACGIPKATHADASRACAIASELDSEEASTP
jgi:hypothetical protein